MCCIYSTHLFEGIDNFETYKLVGLHTCLNQSISLKYSVLKNNSIYLYFAVTCNDINIQKGSVTYIKRPLPIDRRANLRCNSGYYLDGQ